MKKITKLLTAFATAVALILGASAFVSCSNSSDSGSTGGGGNGNAYTPGTNEAEAMDFVNSHPEFTEEQLEGNNEAKVAAEKYEESLAKLNELVSKDAQDAFKEMIDNITEMKNDVKSIESEIKAAKDADELVVALNKVFRVWEDDDDEDGTGIEITTKLGEFFPDGFDYSEITGGSYSEESTVADINADDYEEFYTKLIAFVDEMIDSVKSERETEIKVALNEAQEAYAEVEALLKPASGNKEVTMEFAEDEEKEVSDEYVTINCTFEGFSAPDVLDMIVIITTDPSDVLVIQYGGETTEDVADNKFSVDNHSAELVAGNTSIEAKLAEGKDNNEVEEVTITFKIMKDDEVVREGTFKVNCAVKEGGESEPTHEEPTQD